MWPFTKKQIRSEVLPPIGLNDPEILERLGVNHGANPHQILGLPAYWRGVNCISDRCANLPLELWVETPDKRTPDLANPARRVACRQFTDWQTSKQGIRTLISNTLRFGNGFALIQRSDDYEVQELTVINPYSVQTFVTQDQFGRLTPSYKIWIQGQWVDYDWTDIIHIRGLNEDGITGFSVSEVLNTALKLNLNIYRHSEKYFERNCAMSMFIGMAPGTSLDPKQAPTFVKTVMDSIRKGEPPLMTNGATLNSFNDSAVEAQLESCKQFSLVDVANCLNCPVSILNGQQVTSYSSLEADNRNFLDNCLNPILSQIETAFTMLLLTEADKNNGHCFEFDRSSLDSPSPTELTVNVATLLGKGVISKHEARQLLGWTGPAPDIEIQPLAADLVNLVAGYVVSADEARPMLGLTGPAPIKPEPPAPIIAPNPTQDAQKDAKTDVKPALKDIARASVERLFERIRKSANKYQDGWIDGHKRVFIDALPGHNVEISAFFNDLDTELRAVTKDEIENVIVYRTENNNLLENIFNGIE